ncbi:MAG: sulfite exporter TauE/SafE family protein, partial [Geminicoccaceae bacterium]
MMADILLANIVVMFAALIQTASGIGFAMIAVPLLALVDLGYVPGPSLLAMLGLSLVMALRGWRDVDRQGLSALLAGLGIGTVVGALSLGALPQSATGLLFGIMVLIALAAGQVGFVPGRSTPAFAFSGAVAGLMGTMAGIHGPALAVLYQGAPPRTARATIALIFIVASCLSLLSLHLSQLFDRAGLLAGFA